MHSIIDGKETDPRSVSSLLCQNKVEIFLFSEHIVTGVLYLDMLEEYLMPTQEEDEDEEDEGGEEEEDEEYEGGGEEYEGGEERRRRRRR